MVCTTLSKLPKKLQIYKAKLTKLLKVRVLCENFARVCVYEKNYELLSWMLQWFSKLCCNYEVRKFIAKHRRLHTM